MKTNSFEVMAANDGIFVVLKKSMKADEETRISGKDSTVNVVLVHNNLT